MARARQSLPARVPEQAAKRGMQATVQLAYRPPEAVAGGRAGGRSLALRLQHERKTGPDAAAQGSANGVSGFVIASTLSLATKEDPCSRKTFT